MTWIPNLPPFSSSGARENIATLRHTFVKNSSKYSGWLDHKLNGINYKSFYPLSSREWNFFYSRSVCLYGKIKNRQKHAVFLGAHLHSLHSFIEQKLCYSDQSGTINQSIGGIPLFPSKFDIIDFDLVSPHKSRDSLNLKHPSALVHLLVRVRQRVMKSYVKKINK